MGGRSTSSGLTARAGAATAGGGASAGTSGQDQQTSRPASAGGLVSDTGVQNMDNAALATFIQQAMSAPRATDGRDDTPAQRIADALGISRNRPESVSSEAFAQFRSQNGENGLMYRTIRDAGGKTARQIAHELTDETGNHALNYGGGRVFGTGLYFAASGRANDAGEAARHSAGYGRGERTAYTIEAMFKPGARVATDNDIAGNAGRAWIRAHANALAGIGIRVNARTGVVDTNNSRMGRADISTTLAMLMGYDAYKESSSADVYTAVFNRGALRVARGNKYDRAIRSTLTR